MRVTIENNTVNTGIAVGGVPGIDTQRMQSEVLVPDGGTTVMGGVLADQEATQRQRTPGMASIPILGNLFKRKLVTKNSTEILFFITPHIYRPDYFGRPTTQTPSSGPRSTSVPQPVPLGNPQTNTSTPNELPQLRNLPQSTSPQPKFWVRRPSRWPAGKWHRAAWSRERATARVNWQQVSLDSCGASC